MKRFSKILFWMPFAVLLTSCSTAELFYDNADRLLLKQMETYLALTNAQQEKVIVLLRERLAYNKQHELPRYHAFLTQIRHALADELTSAELDALLTQTETLYNDTAAGFLPPLAQTLALLDPEQINYLAERLADDMDDSRERLEEREADWQEQRITRMFERAEEWLGELDAGQQAMLRDYILALPDTYAAALAYRSKRQGGLLTLLRAGAGADAIENYLTANWLRDEQLDPALAAQWDRQSQMFHTLALQLDATLTSEQRRHLLSKLDEYRELLVSLHDAPFSDAAASGATTTIHIRQD